MSIPVPPASPWLSVLVPAFKVEDYIEACLCSVMSQWREGVEVLVLDDASPDRSAEIARAVAGRFPGRIRVFGVERNGGLAAARNRLLEDARGDFVWFLDSDDVLMPGAIDGLKAVLDAGPVDLVMCDFAMVRERFGLKHRLRGEAHRATFRGPRRVGSDAAALAEGIMRGRQLHAWSKIARREVWAAAPFPVGRYYEDIPALPALLGEARSWRHVAKPWVGYRQRAGSILAHIDAGKTAHLMQGLVDLDRGIRGRPSLATPAVLRALRAFCLRTLASTAKRQRRGQHDDAASSARAVIGELFPEGLPAAFREVRQDLGVVPAWTMARRLRAAGLID